MTVHLPKTFFPGLSEATGTTTRLGLREFLIGAGFFLVVVLVIIIMFLLEKYV
jgi:hypothetical protein